MSDLDVQVTDLEKNVVKVFQGKGDSGQLLCSAKMQQEQAYYLLVLGGLITSLGELTVLLFLGLLHVC